MQNAMLYQRLLGTDFERLPPVLQRFHRASCANGAIGTFTVRCGRGPLRRLVARALQLPNPGRCVPVRLFVVTQGQSECWVRDFGSHRIETLQWAEDGFLIEQAWPLRIVFELKASEAGIEFVFLRCQMGRWTLPRFLWLEVAATTQVAPEANETWEVNVEIRSSWLGLLSTYSGTMRPLPNSALPVPALPASLSRP